MSDQKHVVVAGDCLSSIANRYGFTWQQVWDYGANAGLKSKRKDPNILYPGDVVTVPSKVEGKESKPQEASHRFIRKSEQAHFSLVLKVDGEPIKNKPCKLKITGQPDRSGNVNGNGEVEIEGSKKITIPSNLAAADLYVGEGPEECIFELLLGQLEPVDTLTGIQQRLNNLGYNAGTEDGIMGPVTKSSVMAFQEDAEIAVDGIAGSQTQDKLKQAHGS